MILAAFITQLRTRAPIFAGRVAGAAEFYRGLRDYNTSMILPAAYVLPLGQDAAPNDSWGGLFQIVHKGIGIAVELDAQRDRRGQDPVMQFDDIEAEIMASCLNFILPDQGDCHQARGTYFTGARYLDLDRARLFYQWEFGLDWQITDADGVQPLPDGSTPVPLRGIEVDIFKAPASAGDMPAAVTMVATDPDNPPPPDATDGPWPAIKETTP